MGEPGKTHAAKTESYVVIPVSLEMKAPGGRVLSDTYLLAISFDQGKTWKYVDGNRLGDKARRDRLFPDFPASLTLPAKTAPRLLKK